MRNTQLTNRSTIDRMMRNILLSIDGDLPAGASAGVRSAPSVHSIALPSKSSNMLEIFLVIPAPESLSRQIMSALYVQFHKTFQEKPEVLGTVFLPDGSRRSSRLMAKKATTTISSPTTLATLLSVLATAPVAVPSVPATAPAAVPSVPATAPAAVPSVSATATVAVPSVSATAPVFHPEPIRLYKFNRIRALAFAEKIHSMCLTDPEFLLKSHLVSEFSFFVSVLILVNPIITQDLVFQHSHPSHEKLRSVVNQAEDCNTLLMDWKKGKLSQEDLITQLSWRTKNIATFLSRDIYDMI